jgi:uncharacterized protein (TIGR00106 family)
MLASFSIVPLGGGSSLSARVAEVLKIVDDSGMPYKVNPMGTVIEGDWDAVMKLIRKCHRTAMKHADRVLLSVVIDDRKGMPNRIDAKVHSVERRLGKSLKK